MTLFVTGATTTRARRETGTGRRNKAEVLPPAETQVHHQTCAAIGRETPSDLIGLDGCSDGRERYIRSAEATVNFSDG